MGGQAEWISRLESGRALEPEILRWRGLPTVLTAGPALNDR